MSAQEQDPHPEPYQIDLPSLLNEQQLRSSLDRALQLIARDLTTATADVMRDHLGEEWATSVNEYTGYELTASDPLFWLDQFKRPHSPLYSAVPWISPGQRRQHLERMRRIRNELFHFAVVYDARRARSDLFTLLSVARSLDLPCAESIAALREHLEMLETGAVVAPPTLGAAWAAAEEAELLRRRVADVTREKERLQEQVDKAHEELAAMAKQGQASSSHSKSLADMEAHIRRLEDEAEIKASHEAILAEQLEDLEEFSFPDLPPEMEEALGNAVGSIGIARSLIRWLRGLLKPEHTGDLVSLEGDIDEYLRKASGFVPHLPSQQPVETVEDFKAAVLTLKELSEGSTLQDASFEITEPGEVSENVTHFIEAVNTWDSLLDRLNEIVAGLLDDLLAESSIIPEAEDEVEGLSLPELGSVWEWPRGDEVWVLSAQNRCLRRPRAKRGPEFTALYGSDQERRAVESWLRLRPEGGRVYVDGDGDVCTLGPNDRLMYLGRLGA